MKKYIFLSYLLNAILGIGLLTKCGTAVNQSDLRSEDTPNWSSDDYAPATSNCIGAE